MPIEGDHTVRAGQWDCPSCGLDKRRSMAEMVTVAGAWWLLTLTFRQPRAYDGDGLEVTPDEHRDCPRGSHVYRYVDKWGKASYRWRTLASCVYCVKRVSLWRRLFVLRVRRIFPAFHYLDVIEDHKNGSYHLHFAVTGVPRDVDPKLTGHVIGRHWYALGGGRVDMAAPPGRDHAGAMGWYLGKYLAKRQEQRMARGHRRWGRSGGFAPEVVMAWSQKWRKRFGDERSAAAQAQARAEAESNPRADSVCGVVGWWHPLLPSVARVRVWMDPPPETVGT